MRYRTIVMNGPIGSSALLGRLTDSGQADHSPHSFRMRAYISVDSKRLKVLDRPHLREVLGVSNARF